VEGEGGWWRDHGRSDEDEGGGGGGGGLGKLSREETSGYDEVRAFSDC